MVKRGVIHPTGVMNGAAVRNSESPPDESRWGSRAHYNLMLVYEGSIVSLSLSVELSNEQRILTFADTN